MDAHGSIDEGISLRHIQSGGRAFEIRPPIDEAAYAFRPEGSKKRLPVFVETAVIIVSMGIKDHRLSSNIIRLYHSTFPQKCHPPEGMTDFLLDFSASLCFNRKIDPSAHFI